MALLDQEAQYNVTKAYEIINNLPESDKYFVKYMLDKQDKFREAIQRENREMTDTFRAIVKYGRMSTIHDILG